MEFFNTLENLQRNVEQLNKLDSVSRMSNIITQTDPKDSLAYQHMAIMKEISDNTKNLEVQAQELKRLADSAEQSAKVANQKAEEAENQSLLAQARANRSFVLSVITLGCSLLINGDKILHNVKTLLSYLLPLLGLE